MRLEVKFASLEETVNIILPLHYNKIVQGLIYGLCKEQIPQLHKEGYRVGGREFRLFVFSRILGKVKRINNGYILFDSPITLKIDSLKDEFIEILTDNMLKNDFLRLGDNLLKVSYLAMNDYPSFTGENLRVKAISPITVYSTLYTKEGNKKTYFYHPTEDGFQEGIKNNLLKKAIVARKEFKENDLYFKLKPLKVNNKDQKLVYYSDFLIKGWMGEYLLEGAPSLLEIAFRSGLGAKNSQGFGMVELVKNNVVGSK